MAHSLVPPEVLRVARESAPRAIGCQRKCRECRNLAYLTANVIFSPIYGQVRNTPT